jgi:hypothetical protein
MQRRRRHRLFGYSADGRTHGLEPSVDGCLGGSIRSPNRRIARPKPRTNRNAASNGDAAFVCVPHCEADGIGIRGAERRQLGRLIPAIPADDTAFESLLHHVTVIRHANGME